MKTRLITSLAIALLLIATLALPAVALEDIENLTASVTVNAPDILDITLTDAGATGIQFGEVLPSDIEIYGDEDQGEFVPAISVDVSAETNVTVDIGIMGSTAGALTIDKWQYSTDFAQSDIAGLSGTYVHVYDDVGASSTNPFYHWISVPTGTAATTYSADVYYKAVKDGESF